MSKDKDSTPWLPSGMMELFESWDTKDLYMWEWGCGGSTPWFGERVKKLWSMEHDGDWYNKVKKQCKDLENVYLMQKPLSGDYITEITRFPDDFFDCIIVDGRNRVECVKAAVRKTRKFLILDNALRGRYAPAIQYIEHQRIWNPTLVEWREPIKGRISKQWHCMVWARQ
jgi:hypothetical protein